MFQTTSTTSTTNVNNLNNKKQFVCDQLAQLKLTLTNKNFLLFKNRKFSLFKIFLKKDMIADLMDKVDSATSIDQIREILIAAKIKSSESTLESAFESTGNAGKINEAIDEMVASLASQLTSDITGEIPQITMGMPQTF